MNPRPKVHDVAARAGVSITAVSLVVNGKASGNIADSTRDRILAAADELGYTPDGVAQSLRQRRTHMLGLVTDSIATSSFAGRLLAGAMDAAAERGYALLTFDSRDHRDLEQDAVRELARRKVDGIIFATMGLRAMKELPATPLPMVLANCTSAQGGRYAVVPDETRAGRRAADYLVGLGHRRIAMLSGPADRPERVGSISGPLRAKAFRSALRSAGLRGDRSVTPVVGWSINDGHAGAMRLLTDETGTLRPIDDRPSAIFAVNDRVATGALLAGLGVGLRIPHDLSIIGFDDQDELAANVVPALTTLALPHREMGQFAVETLIDALSSDVAMPVRTDRLECVLIERDSAAPPRSR